MNGQKQCPNVDKCPVFEYFLCYAKKVYMDVYCQGNYAICKRYVLRCQGKPVPPDLMPYGSSTLK